jgi:glucoamylase
MGTWQYSLVRPVLAQSDLTAIAPYMFWLMFRNVASDGFVFEDPVNTGVVSQPGCVLASPAWENTATNVSQDYACSWTRDAAITAIELAAGPLPTSQPLIGYVQFAQTCQNSASAIGHFDRVSFLINGTPRDWTDQTDGPALQTLAIVRLYDQLGAGTLRKPGSERADDAGCRASAGRSTRTAGARFSAPEAMTRTPDDFRLSSWRSK